MFVPSPQLRNSSADMHQERYRVMAGSPSREQVQHSAENSEFYFDMPNGERALIRYHLLDGQKIDFYSTFVPVSARGHGVAAILVNHALDWAERQGLKIETSCWYAEKKMAQRNKA